jgi:hypothetical protein
MPEFDRNEEEGVREAAYFIWEQEGRPHGQAQTHWVRAVDEASGESPDRAAAPMDDEEKILAGRLDANIPALLTKDVPGG